MHARVQNAGRLGVVSMDLRPEHPYVKIRWDDTGEESGVIKVSDVSPASLASPSVTGTPLP